MKRVNLILIIFIISLLPMFSAENSCNNCISNDCCPSEIQDSCEINWICESTEDSSKKTYNCFDSNNCISASLESTFLTSLNNSEVCPEGSDGKDCKNENNENCCCCKKECVDSLEKSLESGCCPDCYSPNKDVYPGNNNPKKYSSTTKDEITEQEFETKTNIKLEFKGEIDNKKIILLNLDRVWQDLPTKAQDLLKQKELLIEIYPLDDQDFGIYSCDSAGICVYDNDEFFSNLANEDPSTMQESFLENIMIKLKAIVGTDVCTIRHEITHALVLFQKKQDYRDIQVKFLDLSEELYGKGLKVISRDGLKYKICPDYQGPMQGGTIPYSFVSPDEDIATMVEKAYCYPNWFEKVLDSEQKCCYDEKYKKKLDILQEYNLISKKEHDNVFEL